MMETGSEFLIEAEDELTSVQLVTSSVVGRREKNKLEQKFSRDLSSLAASKEKGKIKTSCCRQVLISSTGVTQEWYSNILGVYSLQLTDGAPVYKMEGSERFLSRPSRGKERQFTWGVNTSPHLAWGWVKSALPANCPNLVRKWAAFDPVKKQITADPTLRVSCHQP